MKIAWICPKPSAPSGGVWFIHRLAKLTQELGYETEIVKEPFDVWWDANPVTDVKITEKTELDDSDWLIVPETNWDKPHIQGVKNKVCFLQNFIWLNKEYFAEHPGPMITCSRFMSNYASDVLGVKPLGKVTPFLDENVWIPGNHAPDRVLIMARRSEIAFYLRDLLEKDGFSVTVIDYAISQKDLAKWLSLSEYYVHLPSPEGFPMAVLEAMRTGTAVVGTTGGGGNEFMFHKQTAYVVQDPEFGLYSSQDEYVRRLREGMNWMRSNPGERVQMTVRARDWSLRYTAEVTKRELVEILKKLETE